MRRGVSFASLAVLITLAACTEPMIMDLPRTDATLVHERSFYTTLTFVPGTSELTPSAADQLTHEMDLASADRGSTLRVAVPAGPLANRRADRLKPLLTRADAQAMRDGRWGVDPNTPNLETDKLLLSVQRVTLPSEACATSSHFSPELREATMEPGCAVRTALDMNVAQPRDLVAAESPPPGDAAAAAPAAPTRAQSRAQNASRARGPGGYKQPSALK